MGNTGIVFYCMVSEMLEQIVTISSEAREEITKEGTWVTWPEECAVIDD